MGRPPKFTDEQFLDAALHLVGEAGPDAISIARIGKHIGAPTGSIYHRFASLDLLRGHLWLRTVARFQAGFIEALGADDLDRAASRASRRVVSWAREHVGEARLLLLYRREDLDAQWPTELREQLAERNAALFAAVRDHTIRRFGNDQPETIARVTIALIDLPYAAGRRYLLAGEGPPPYVDDLVEATCRSLLRT